MILVKDEIKGTLDGFFWYYDHESKKLSEISEKFMRN